MVNRGDFAVSDFEAEFAEDKQDARSDRSKDVDAQKRAPVTTNAQAWASDMDDLDFPGVDTPRADPNVLPKDLMDPAPTNLTARAGDDVPAETREVSAAELERQALSKQDISLAPDEAFKGVGATSSREMGGFNSTYGGEESPLNETTPPDIRRGETPEQQTQNDVGFFYAEYEDDLDLTPKQFKREVRKKKREMSGMADDFTAAGLVVEDYTD